MSVVTMSPDREKYGRVKVEGGVVESSTPLAMSSRCGMLPVRGGSLTASMKE